MNTDATRGLKISIVTPSYNQGHFIEETIRSVVNQDYPNVEYIVIDGGSTDSTTAHLNNYSAQIDYFSSEPDDGQADAIGKGFELASGDIMGWLNSDDVLLPGALSRVADYFESRPSISAVSGGGYFIDENGHPLKGFGTFSLGVPASYDRFRYLLAQDGVFQPSTFWRSRDYHAVGGIDRKLEFIMDLDLFTRLAKRGQFGQLRTPLACFRHYGENKSSVMNDVRIRESRLYATKYGLDAEPDWYRKMMRYRYRVPSLIRKLGLTAMRIADRHSLVECKA